MVWLNRFIYAYAVMAASLALAGFIGYMSTPARANAEPVVGSVVMSVTTPNGAPVDAINLSELATTLVYVHGTVSDADGASDINADQLQVDFYRNGLANTFACPEDNNNCYRVVGGCQITNQQANSEDYECIIPLQYYADPTDIGTWGAEQWEARILATDMSGATSSVTVATEVNSLTALNLSGDLGYGAFGLGTTSTSDVALTITNTGNTALNVEASGADMACARGAIPVSNQHYAFSPGQDFSVMTSLTATPTLNIVNLNKQTSAASAGATMYFKLVAPVFGVSGSCTGLNTITAVSAG